MNKCLSAKWLHFFLSFTMVTTQILPAGYTQDANQNFTESPDGRSVPVVSLEAIQEDERAKAEAAQAEKAAMEANSYLMSIKESPISKADDVDAPELSMMESSSRPAKEEVKLHSKAEVEEMAAMIVRSYLGNKSVQFEYEWNHSFMYASEQVVNQDSPTLFTPLQGSLTLSRKLGSGVLETYTLTIGDQGLLFSSAEVKNGDKILSSVSWGYDGNGVKISESKTENLYDEAGNQIESRRSWKNMTADGKVTNESANETFSKYDGENLVSQTTKSSSRYDNNGTPQVSESSTSLERVYAGNVVISEISTSRGSQNGEETSGSTSTRKVELDAAGNAVYSITESNSWSSYNGTKSEYSYSTTEKSAYSENGDLIEKVTRSENKSTGYSSSSETHLINTYENGFLVQAVTKSSSTYNGNQNSSWSSVTRYKRDAVGRPVSEETTYSYNGVENNRTSVERVYLDEKSEKLTGEISKYFYLQGNVLQLNSQQSLKLEYNKEGMLVKTHHQQDSFYGQDNALSYRNTVETVYNADGKPVSVISKSYYPNGNELALQSWSELKYRYSDKNADGKTHVIYSSRTELNADGVMIHKEIKRYDPSFSMENPSINEPRVMYDIAMPAYSYYMPVYWGWGGGLEKGLLSRDMQYFSSDENGDSFLTSTSGDRYWLDGEGKAFKQRNYTKSFNQEGDKTSQITQEYDLIGQQYNYGCCYEVMSRDAVANGASVVQADGQVSLMAARADSMMYGPYPYYYNSGRRLTLYDELRYDESGEVSFRKTQRNEYVNGLLASAKLVIREGDVTRTIKETYAFDALGRAAKIIRHVYGPKGELQLTDERTYEYNGFGYNGYGYRGYYTALESAVGGSVAASDKMMSAAIWAPWNAASVKSVRVSLTNHMTGESVKAFISYTNADPREAGGEGQLIAIPYDYYGGVSYNAADITGSYVNKEGVSTPIQGRFKSDGNEHALPTEKLMELLISYAGKNTDPNEKAIQEAIDHFMELFDFKGLSDEAIAKIRASIHVKSAKQDEWSNGCVGWNTPSMMCTMAFVRGLNITLELFGNEYELHANRLDPAKTAAITAMNSWLSRGIDLSQIKIESSGLKGNEGEVQLDGTLKPGKGETSEPVFVVILSNTVSLETERFEVSFYGNKILSSRRFDSKGALIYEKFSDGWEIDYQYSNADGSGAVNAKIWSGLSGLIMKFNGRVFHVRFDVPQGNAEDAAGYLRASLLELIEREKIGEGEHKIIVENLNIKEMACTNSIPGNCFSSGELQFTLGNLRYLYAVRKSQIGSEPAVFKAEIISVTKMGSFFDLPEDAVAAIADFLGVEISDIVDLKSDQRDFLTCMGPGCAIWSYFVSVTAVINGSKVHYAGHVTGGAWGYDYHYYMTPNFPNDGTSTYDPDNRPKRSPGFSYIQPTVFLLAVHPMIDGRALNAIVEKASEFGVVEEVIFEPHQDRAYCMGTGCAMWSGDLKVTVSSAKGKAFLKGEMSEIFDVGTERSFSVMLELLDPGIEEVSSPVVTGTFHIPDDSLMSTLQRSVYTVTGDARAWLIDRLPEWRKILDKLDGVTVSFIPGDSFSLEGQEIFTSGILITQDRRAYVLADGKIKQYKDAQFITLSESRCPANPAMGAPCSLTENAMKMPGYETLHEYETVLLEGGWVVRSKVVLIARPDDGTIAEIKSDEQLLSELHSNSKVLIYEEFDHVATACAPIDGAVCASAKKVFYSYLRENGDRVYQIASINETRVFGSNDVKRTANVVSEADLERALRAAGFHAIQDSGNIFSGIIDYNKTRVEKYEELPGDATDDLRSIPYHVIYSFLDCPDGGGLKSCATESYEARVIKSRIKIPEAESYLKYEVSFIKETRLIVNYEGGQAYVDWIEDEEGALIRTDVKTGEEAKFVNARDVMSCRTSANGMTLCASLAFGPNDVQIGSYTKYYFDGSTEERIIFGIPADKNPPVEEKGSPVVTGIFQMPDDSMMSTLQRSVYTIEGENESWLIDRLEELRGTLDTLHGQKVSFIPGKSFSLEGRKIFTSGIIITGDGIAFVIEDGKIKSYKDAQFLKVSESRCPANPAMGAPCSIEEMAMKMPGYEEIHRHEEVFVKDGWIVTRTIVLIGIPFEDTDPSEYKTDEALLSELHNGAKIQIYEEFDHAATACAPMLGSRCSNTKNVFYSYLLNGDRVYQIAAISETSIYGRNITRRSANIVSEADLERALRAAGFHALQDSGNIFSGIIDYNKTRVEKYEELPGDATDDLRSIPYHVIYSVLDCPDGGGLKSCATESYEARVIKSRIKIPEAESYLKYEVSFIKETRLIVNYEGGRAYVDWIAGEKGALIRTDVKTGEEVKFFKALEMMSCSYPKDGPALCADNAFLPGYEQVGYYRKDLPDGGYEDRIIMGLRSENPPVEEKGSPVVTGIFQMPDDSMMSTLQRSVYTIEGENESWLIDRLEELRGTLDTLHGQKVSFIPGKSFSLEGRKIFTSGIIITGDGIAFVIEDGKIKSYKDAQFLKVSESRCPANSAMGAPCSVVEPLRKMPGYEEIHRHEEVFVKDGWIVTRTIVLLGIPFEFKPNFVSVEKMDAAEADRIRKAVGEGLELLGYEIDDGRPYDGNLVHHYAFRALSSSIVHMQQATNSNIIKQDANGLIYEERAMEDFGLDIFVNDQIRFIKEPDPRYIEVSAGVSRIEVAPGEQLMFSVVMELGGRRIMTLRDIHTPWTFTPLTAESAFRIKAAIHHGLEMKQIGKVRMKLTGETAAKCPQGQKCSSYKEYEILYFADGKEFLADGQIVLTTFEGKQFTYYEIQNVREAMSKEEKIRLAIEAAGQDLEALAAQMIIPENQALTEEEFAALDAKLKEIAEKMRALLVALRDKIREIEGDDSSDGIIKMFGGPDGAVRLEQRAGALLSDFYGRLMRTDAIIVAGGQKVRIPVQKMTEILIGALPNGRWSPAEDYAKLIGYTPEFHPGDGIYLMNVFQHVMLSLAMGPSLRDLREMVKVFVMKSDAKGLITGDTVNLRVFKSLMLGTQAKIDAAIKAAGEEIDAMLKGFTVAEVLSEQEVEALLADLDSLYQKIRARLTELKEEINGLESANEDPSEPVLFKQFGGGPEGAVRIERDAEIALGNLYGIIMSRDVRIKASNGSEVVLPLSKMIEILSAVVGKDQMYSVEALEKVLGLEVAYDSGRIYFMHVFQFMIAARAAFPDVRTALIEYMRGLETDISKGGDLDLDLFRLSLLGARAKIQEAVAEAYLKAASDAGVLFFKAPEISLKKMAVTSMSKNLPPTEFGLEIVYTADGGGELGASVQLSITGDGVKASVISIKTPFGDSSEEIARAVIEDLSRRTGLSSDNFKVQSVEARNWPDGCLGLPEPGAFCTMAIVPGYRIVIVDAAGKNYVYRTGRTKGQFKLEPEKEAPSMKLAALPADVEAGYKGFNAGRTLLSVARGYGKVSEANAEAGMKKFNLISDNRSSATAQGEFVFSSEQGFSLDALTGLSFKGTMKSFVLVFVDAAGNSIQQKVSLKDSQTENIVGIDFSANPDFDAANIRSFRILHSQRERVELTVSYGLLADTKNLIGPTPQENFELEGKAFDASRLAVLPQGVQGEAFGTTVEEGKGQAAFASLLDSTEGKKVTYHFAGSDSAMAGYEVSFGSNADSAAKREIALKGDGKAVELVMILENGEVITKTVVLPEDFMNYELESGIKQLFIRTTRLMAGHDKGSFLIRFGNELPAANKLITYGRNTVPERLRSAISKLRDAHKIWKERYKSRKFSFTKA